MGKSLGLDQARGMFVGLAVGDAVGTTVEFSPRGSFPRVTDMVGGGPFRLDPGQWTDDTSMALCLAESLLHCAGWDAGDCMRRFVNWRDHGYNSVTGECFDIGNQTTSALDRFLETNDPYAGPIDERKSGNGGIMRLAPAVIAYAHDPGQARLAAQQQSKTTHASPTCLDYAARMADILWRCDGAVVPKVSEPPREASGYVVHSFDAACWAVGSTGSFEEAVLASVNLGGDADTVGAITGQIAGALYGHEAIPAEWRSRLYWHDKIVGFADRLWRLSPGPLEGAG